MRQLVILSSPLLVTLGLASLANAATLHVSPSGASTAPCTREEPCDLTTAGNTASAGDTVILLDGVYKTTLSVKNSGSASAWITFQADECATPIIEGIGVETDTGDNAVDQPTGVGSNTATYLRFVGLVSRGWNTGFGNGWTGQGTTNSNGHFEYEYCIADGNGRTGFTFYSAEGLHIRHCISSHNGSSVEHSWSSGMTLYEAQGSDNLIEGSVSFENVDAQNHSDGSGFIADENANNATFLNNIAFRNGGSCLRLTSSSGARFINNTCFHNAQDPQATGPTNPGEIYFTNDQTRIGATVKNNVFVSTGNGAGAQAVLGQPSSGWSNNVVQNGGTVSFFASPEGENPDFALSSSATALIGKGSSGDGVPTSDIGFDPKCIVKKVPTMIGNYPRSSWWQYSVDIDYIKSIGGVARCFRPKTRSGSPDIGAYANGAVTPIPGPCTPSSTGGAPGTGGSSNIDTSDAGGSTGVDATTSTVGGAIDDTNSPNATGMAGGGAGTAANSNSGEQQPASGCGCRVSDASARSAHLVGLGLLGMGLLRLRRRRRAAIG